MSVLVIAEAGVCHNGDLATAFKLCDAAKEAGADVVKFQTWTQAAIRSDSKDRDLLERLRLSFDDTEAVASYCRKIDIEFCSTPDDIDSLRFLVEECGVKRIKIGSGSLTYKPLVNAAFETGLPVILSTGMATMNEISKALSCDFPPPFVWPTLLHCISLYPCPTDLANVKAIRTLRNAFDLDVGYSDHTLSVDAVPAAAVAMGATVIEKHFTLDSDQDGPDHAMSLEPHQLKFMIRVIREAEQCLGSGDKAPGIQEQAMIPRVRKDADGRQPGL